MVLKAEAWGWTEVPQNSISELFLNNIFSNNLDANICERLIQSPADTELGITISKDQVILWKKLKKERKKKKKDKSLSY